MSYTIGITTFSKRIHYLKKLISQIRSHTNNDIILVINGEHNVSVSEIYRKEVLTICLNYEKIYPIFFNETRGLSKMWNTIITLSNTENSLILNDDLEINNSDIFNVTNDYIQKPYCGLTKINGSFSHFIVNKKIIDEIGYFDERLLGFGEEDGDITYRFLKHNKHINSISVSGCINIVSPIRHDHITDYGINKYSKYNRDFIYGEKYKSGSINNIKGLFDTPMIQNKDDINPYPLESYFETNKYKL